MLFSNNQLKSNYLIEKTMLNSVELNLWTNRINSNNNNNNMSKNGSRNSSKSPDIAPVINYFNENENNEKQQKTDFIKPKTESNSSSPKTNNLPLNDSNQPLPTAAAANYMQLLLKFMAMSQQQQKANLLKQQQQQNDCDQKNDVVVTPSTSNNNSSASAIFPNPFTLSTNNINIEQVLNFK